VVLPDPVPPLMRILYFAFTNFSKNSAASLVMDPNCIKSSISIAFSGNLRIVRIGPFSATGGNTTFTRDPFSNLASTIGVDSFTTLLQEATICWITSSSFSLDSKVFSHFVNFPSFSTKTLSVPLIIISVTVGSSTNSCNMSSLRIA